MVEQPIRKKPRQPLSIRLDTDLDRAFRALTAAAGVSLSDCAEELIFFALRSRAYANKAKALADNPAPVPAPRQKSSGPRFSVTVRLQIVDLATLQTVAERFGMTPVAFAEELIAFSLNSRTYKAKLAALPDQT